jgi:Secretion system C-terminal sorting domain
MPYTNMLPSVVVNNNSSVFFGERVSFYSDNVAVQSGSTLDIGPGHLEKLPSGPGTLVLDGTLGIGGDNTMPVYGTYTMNSTSTVDYNSTTSSQEIKNLPTPYQTLRVSGTTKYIENGNVTVQNQLLLDQVIDIRGNDLILGTGATIVNSGSYHIATTGSGSFKMENVSSGNYPIGPDLINFNGFEFDNNGTALDWLSARVGTGVTPTHPNSAYCLPRTWEIQKEGVLNADFTFKWTTDQENANFTAARVDNRIKGFINHTGEVWKILEETIIPAGSGTPEDPYGAVLNNMAIVSGFCLGDGDHPLPVTLTFFTASYSKNSAVLNWITESETDNLGFNLYRSENENGFENDDYLQINSIFIDGMGTTSSPINYSFVDEYPTVEGHTYYYWLQSVSTANELELFGPVSIEIPISGQLPVMTILSSNYPNPFNPETMITFNIKENETGVLSIFNLKGEKILKQYFEAGEHQYHWNANGLSSGIYFYKLSSPTTNITKKMILMK